MTPNIPGIGNCEVLMVGILLISGAFCIRTLVKGKGWGNVFSEGEIRKMK